MLFRSARRQRGEEPSDEIVGVGRERDGRGIGQAEDGDDAALRARDELAEDSLPFVVGEPRGVGERPAMGVACGVRRKMMAVRREMDAPWLLPRELEDAMGYRYAARPSA